MPDASLPRPDHVIHDSRTGSFACRHCGSSQPIAMPISISGFLAMGKAYLKSHAGCVAQGAR